MDILDLPYRRIKVKGLRRHIDVPIYVYRLNPGHYCDGRPFNASGWQIRFRSRAAGIDESRFFSDGVRSGLDAFDSLQLALLYLEKMLRRYATGSNRR